jgi:hypothetical protein
MHPENWPNSIKENEFFCISDLASEVSTPIDQAHVLDLFKYVGYPFKFQGLYAGSMVLASDNKGPLPIKLKYINRVTKLSEEEVNKFFNSMNSAGDDLTNKMKDILSKFSQPEKNEDNGNDTI